MVPGSRLVLLLVGLPALSVGFAVLKAKEECVIVYTADIVASCATSHCAVSLSSAAVSILSKTSKKLESTGVAGATGLTTHQLLVASQTWFLTSGDSESSSHCMRVTWVFINHT